MLQRYIKGPVGKVRWVSLYWSKIAYKSACFTHKKMPKVAFYNVLIVREKPQSKFLKNLCNRLTFNKLA